MIADYHRCARVISTTNAFVEPEPRKSGKNRLVRRIPPSKLAFLAGFEPTTFRLGGGRSILLSYRNIFNFSRIFKVF